MTWQHIRLEQSSGVARLMLARPKHNVLNIEMMKEIQDCLRAQAADASLKCLVIAGDGPSWCAGVDVGEHRPELVDQMMSSFNGIFEIMEGMDIPLIAAVHGPCLGGGMELAIACDIIVASDRASFGQPEIRLGFFPPYAAVRLPGLVGPSRAIEICTTGRTYSAQEARDMGMVSQLVAADKFADALAELIDSLQAASPLIIRLNKQAVKRHLGMSFPAALAGVTDLFLNNLMKTEDTLEGIKSFYEKRKPVWRNR